MPGSGGDDGRAEGYGTGAPARDGTLKPWWKKGKGKFATCSIKLLHATSL